MKKFFIAFFVASLAFGNFVNTQSQQLSPSLLQELQNSIQQDASFKAARNAIQHNSLKKLAKNPEVLNSNDHLFTHEIKVNKITNQYKSGRCWMFTSLNVLRPQAAETFGVKNFQFSTAYLYFWDILEKSNLFLENILATADKPWDDRKVDFYLSSPVGDGGVWNSFTNLATKYGMVPMGVMNENFTTKNTREMMKMLNKILRVAAYQIREKPTDAAQLKLQSLKKVYRLLSLCVGTPPDRFDWKYKNDADSIVELQGITPLEFAKKFSLNKYQKFVMLMDDPTRAYNKLYEIESDRNVMEGRNWQYINLPASQIKQYAVKSLQANQAMYFSCDVGKQLNSDAGYLDLRNYDYESLLGIDLKSHKKMRVLTKQSGSSHGMNLVGVDLDAAGKPRKWKLENSWGEKSGHKGFLSMTDEWFDAYMFRLVILDRFIDAKVLKILEQQPTLLPPWDPMFDFDN